MKKIVYLFALAICFFGCASNKITTYEVIGLRTVLTPIENPNNFFIGSSYEDFSPTKILDGKKFYDSFEQMLDSNFKPEEGSNFVEIVSYTVDKKDDDLYDFDILTKGSKTPKFGSYSFLDKNEIEAKTKIVKDENRLTDSSKYLVLGSEISKSEFDEISKYVLKSNKTIFEIIYLVDGNYIYVCLEGK